MKISKKLNNSTWFKLLIFIPLLGLLLYTQLNYEYIGELSATLRHPVSLKTFIDDYIPFNFYIIYPYILSLLWPIAAGIAFVFKRKISAIQFISFYVASILIQLSCYIIYLIFPTSAESVMITSFDPSILNWGMFEALQSLYTSSTPYNAFPSLHVVPMVYLSVFLYKHWRSLFWIFLPMALLASSGTVLLKFHVFADVLGGIAMGIFGYYVLYEKVALKYVNKFLLVEEDAINKEAENNPIYMN